MLATPHMLVGAAIAKKSRWATVALLAALASHPLLDWIPHLDSHALFGSATGGPTAGEATMAALDVLVGVTLVVWFSRGLTNRRLVLAGALCGIVIDLIDNVRPWNMWLRALPATSWFHPLHHGIQHNLTPDHWILGFGTQVVVVAAAIWLLLARDRGLGSVNPGGR